MRALMRRVVVVNGLRTKRVRRLVRRVLGDVPFPSEDAVKKFREAVKGFGWSHWAQRGGRAAGLSIAASYNIDCIRRIALIQS